MPRKRTKAKKPASVVAVCDKCQLPHITGDTCPVDRSSPAIEEVVNAASDNNLSHSQSQLRFEIVPLS